MTCVAYILFSIKWSWLLNIEICLARILLVYACYYWFLIKYSITNSTCRIRVFSYFLLNCLIYNSTDLAFTNFSLRWESISFFFVASIVEYFLLITSRNLFWKTASLLSCICFFSVFSNDVFPFNFSNFTWKANQLYIIFHSLDIPFFFVYNIINFL